jgi:hypothetical protein
MELSAAEGMTCGVSDFVEMRVLPNTQYRNACPEAQRDAGVTYHASRIMELPRASNILVDD